MTLGYIILYGTLIIFDLSLYIWHTLYCLGCFPHMVHFVFLILFIFIRYTLYKWVTSSIWYTLYYLVCFPYMVHFAILVFFFHMIHFILFGLLPLYGTLCFIVLFFINGTLNNCGFIFLHMVHLIILGLFFFMVHLDSLGYFYPLVGTLLIYDLIFSYWYTFYSWVVLYLWLF